ncbi:MAG: holliday junction helicase RuvA [Campylobacterota bacterium]|nr:holliday junction helicase RuvA [Campylobacterota bacterium]
MICGVGGKIIKKELSFVDVLTSGGVAYRIFVSINCYSAIKSDEVFFYTTLIMREDSMLLHGFIDTNEQKMFEMLLKVNGVGPKVATAICSTFLPSEFTNIIESKNITALKRVPGIGPKSAGMILVQLGGFVVELTEKTPANKAHEEAIMALESLGFKKEAIQKNLAMCRSTDTQGLVKEALKYFQK